MSTGPSPQSSSRASSQSATSSALRRGRACGNCRRRKIKCDGKRPICTNCERHARPGDECEYADIGRSRTQVLEEQVARLESRIRELEEPDDQTAIRLHNPYSQPQSLPQASTSSQASQFSLGQQIQVPGLGSPLGGFQQDISQVASPLQTAFSPSSAPGYLNPQFSSASGSGSFSASQPAQATGSPIQRSPTVSQAERLLEEPPASVIQPLLQHFLLHAYEFGFFLHPRRFLEAALLPLPMGNPARPSPALLNAAYLWGVHLLQSEAYAHLEPVFLSRALLNSAIAINTSSDVSSSPEIPAQRAIHAIQAEVLLSTYFFKCARILEGKYHLSAAVALVLGCRLHQTPRSDSRDLFGIPQPVLPEPTDPVDNGERVNAFWTVFSMNNYWGVVMGLPTGHAQSHIEIPWPLDIGQYEHVSTHATMSGAGNHTVENFLNQIPQLSTGGMSLKTLTAKASILFERAANLSYRLRNNLGFAEAASIANSFGNLDSLIDNFRASLPSLRDVAAAMPQSLRSVLLSHTLASAAVIELHFFLGTTSVQSQQKALAAAESVFGDGLTVLAETVSRSSETSAGSSQGQGRGQSGPEQGQVDPVLGALWTRVSQVLVQEIARLRMLRATWNHETAAERERELAETLDRGIGVMAMFSTQSNLMRARKFRDIVFAITDLALLF